MKVAIAHHWLTSYRGGERVAEQMAGMFPGSEAYTLVHNSAVSIPGLDGHPIFTSILNRIPKISRFYRHLLPLHPWAIARMRVPDDVDVLLSSDASLIKGITTSDNTTHICYCHSPPRYLWELGSDYKRASLAARVALDRFASRLRKFDRESAGKVDHFIANSSFVADRISKYYDRDSEVIYPPVAVDDFQLDRPREDFHLVISELVPYKRIDLAIDAYNRLGKRLVVIGDGPERKSLERLAKPNIEFLGRQPFSVLKDHFETSQAFIFPGIEDFGITPVEAQAAGCPVIAFRAGGALETVVEGKTGLFFDEQTADALVEVVERFDPQSMTPEVCRENAQRFSAQNFRDRYMAFLERKLGRRVSVDETQNKTQSNTGRF